MQHRVETRVESNGTIILHDLPFSEGEKVAVIITTHTINSDPATSYSLRGLPVRYENPFGPIAEHDWEIQA